MHPEHEGTDVSSSQPALSPHVSGALMWLSSASQMVNFSAGALRDIFSSGWAGDVRVSSGRLSVPGPSVSFVVLVF